MPAITKPSNHFNTVLYSGANPASQTVTVGFQPDFTWIKSRTQTYGHYVFDVLRTPTYALRTDTTAAEVTGDALTFTSTGFTTTASAGATNDPTGAPNNFVCYSWKAGDTTVTNTNGSISSQVRVNATAGFSVVTYTGTVSYPQTIGHGLGAVPQFIIVKNRSRITNWAVYHVSVGNTKALYLNATDAAYADAGFWNNTSPSSTVFTGDNGVGYTTNGATDNYVAYCWTPIAGYSAFGSYKGNASTNGPFVYTGFKPEFVMIKSTGVENWIIHDSVRSTSNPAIIVQYADDNQIDDSNATYRSIDMLSNGFKIRTSQSQENGSGTVYTYAAFAEAPFKFSNAR